MIVNRPGHLQPRPQEITDNPTVTFGAFDTVGRPWVLYLMLWGLPRLDE
jgi:hypothetical protein